MDTLEDTLAHFGIKGMRWGVRRPVGSSGHVEGGSSHGPSSDAERASEYHSRAKSTGVHSLSNQELEHLTKRLNLEQQYSRLTSGGSRKSAGAKFAKDILTQVGKQQAAKLASDAASKAVAGALKR